MLDSLKNCQPQTYAALRIVAGFLFLWHGAQKLLGFPLPTPEGAPSFILYIAGPIELIGGALIMVGLFTRPVAFLASGLMAFAYFLGHVFRPVEDPGVLALPVAAGESGRSRRSLLLRVPLHRRQGQRHLQPRRRRGLTRSRRGLILASRRQNLRHE